MSVDSLQGFMYVYVCMIIAKSHEAISPMMRWTKSYWHITIVFPTYISKW